ncbi:hypothetical protein OESDEN_04491 [Oesophagostomum dentatum]|uniref:Uncharacterized protein n=1 Tax=Oesophagostomum dentatum TaxID=61180 RepID=A0A0B1THJ7_OESDE|nr:hypothetical protein OESDEN_04491 [Oesophagostomum dentatum]
MRTAHLAVASGGLSQVQVVLRKDVVGMSNYSGGAMPGSSQVEKPLSDLQLLQTPGYNTPEIKEQLPRSLYFLYAIPFFIFVSYLIFAFLHRAKLEAPLLYLTPKEPKFPECGRISPSNFEFCGPLKIQSRLKCDVKHELSGVQSAPIENVVYDENLNEVVDIGSNIELVMMSDTTATSEQQPVKRTGNTSQCSVSSRRSASASNKSMKSQSSHSAKAGHQLKSMRTK